MKIIITAANGFIGKTLVHYFKEKYEVIALVRKIPAKTEGVNYQLWDGETLGEWTIELEGALAVINLAGRSVNCRYNEKNKQAIYDSRLDSTEVVGKAIEQCADKPKVWINAASATIYKHSFNPMTEKDGIIGEGFSVDVCQRWEQKFNDYKRENVRQIILRTAIVLGQDGGVMQPFNNLAKFGLGGKMAGGEQMFSWIHEKDLCRAVDFLIENERCTGVYNLSAPTPVTNAQFMTNLRQVNMIPFGIPSPKWLLKLDAWLIGTETELIFKSRFVVPERLLEEGFEFEFPTIKKCLENLASLNNNMGDIEQKWAVTGITGSFIFALIVAIYVFIKSWQFDAVLYTLFGIFALSTVFSLLCSFPVFVFAYVIRKKDSFTNKLAHVRNFQLILFGISLLIGAFIMGFENIAAEPRFFLQYAIMLTIYLLTGFIIWRQKTVK